MGYAFAAYMAARLVSSFKTTRTERGCSWRYFFTVFLLSPTSMARTMSPLGANSLSMLSSKRSSLLQIGHQVVQNWKRTTLPLTEALLKVCPSIVLAWKFGAG